MKRSPSRRSLLWLACVTACAAGLAAFAWFLWVLLNQRPEARNNAGQLFSAAMFAEARASGINDRKWQWSVTSSLVSDSLTFSLKANGRTISEDLPASQWNSEDISALARRLWLRQFPPEGAK